MLSPCAFFAPVSFQGGRLRRGNACLGSMLGPPLLWSTRMETELPPGHWSREDGGHFQGLVWEVSGVSGGGWGDKEASYSFPSGQGPGGGVSRPLGKRRRPEPEPLRRRQKGKVEELEPPSAMCNPPEAQEQRERARLQRALQVWGRRGAQGHRPQWCGKEPEVTPQSSAPSPRPQCLHHPPALTRATRAAAATTSGPQTPAVCPGQ